MDKKVWYISGASNGLGLALLHKLLTKGYRVAASSRLLPALMEAAGGNITSDFLPLEVDPDSEGSIAESFRTTWMAFGRIDVVVNNAGLGIATGGSSIPEALNWLCRQGHGQVIDISPTDTIAIDYPHIRYTTVMLGAFRTQLLNKTISSSGALHVSIDGRQPADPLKAATALIQLTTMPQPPTLLVLGSDAYSRATAKMSELSFVLNRALFC